jgi:hypothetical protein
VSQALARPDCSGAWRRQGRNIAYALAVPLLLCLAKTLGS